MKSEAIYLRLAEYDNEWVVSERPPTNVIPLKSLPGYIRTALRQRGRIQVKYFPTEETYGDIL